MAARLGECKVQIQFCDPIKSATAAVSIQFSKYTFDYNVVSKWQQHSIKQFADFCEQKYTGWKVCSGAWQCNFKYDS